MLQKSRFWLPDNRNRNHANRAGSYFCGHGMVDFSDSEAAEVIEAENANGYFTVNMCSFHYRDYRSDKSIGKPFYIKDVPVQERHNKLTN